jgi:hypothetical protein
MQRFIIERTVPGIGDYSPEQTSDILNKTRAALASNGGHIHWQQSFITADKVFSIYIAPDESSVREFCKHSPLPPGDIYPIRSVVDLTTT